MKKLLFLSITILVVFVIAGCGSSPSAPAAGTIEGRIHFNNASPYASIHPCQVSEYSPGAPINEASVDSSGIASEGWSATEGFSWQGDVRAPGFVCTLKPDLKFKIGSNLTAGSETAFTIFNVPPGKYTFVVVYSKGKGDSVGLVYSENSVPMVIELTSEHGIDTGVLTFDNK
jgi:hypothetical protein